MTGTVARGAAVALAVAIVLCLGASPSAAGPTFTQTISPNQYINSGSYVFNWNLTSVGWNPALTVASVTFDLFVRDDASDGAAGQTEAFTYYFGSGSPPLYELAAFSGFLALSDTQFSTTPANGSVSNTVTFNFAQVQSGIFASSVRRNSGDLIISSASVTIEAVPQPGALLLLGAGFLGVALLQALRRR